MRKICSKKEADENKKNNVSEYKKDKPWSKYKEQHVGKAYNADDGKVFYYQKLEEPETKERLRLESLPYTVIASCVDPEYLAGDMGESGAEEYMKLRPGALDLCREEREVMSKVKGFYGNFPDLGMFYGAETLLEAFRIVRKIYDIKKRYVPILYQHGNYLEVLGDIAVSPKHDWFSEYGYWVYQWLKHIDNWPKIRYDYVLRGVLSPYFKNHESELDILNLLIKETAQEADIRELFAEEIPIVQKYF